MVVEGRGKRKVVETWPISTGEVTRGLDGDFEPGNAPEKAAEAIHQ